ncbi:5-histidylcysteine sulfoxide synthase [Candidatus Methylospira mobilis]|uniref:5-histidylcysteine sulfoxide synthase n=1 Tax=Candidatus Methylospira mobilis TaxID=1808979 RepID=UPI0028EAEE01|nr:5-histidylcysteine sulfoxide synthase [Candidatus Methylospira mobilis]WNV03344.1 5-histidylcysteine sulfoxide synthase [Candidatus Methylospira mobilis]
MPFSRTPLLDGENANEKRSEILRYFVTTFDCYERLFETLNSEAAYYLKPIRLRHPLIFYFGHTATFFTNKLLLAGLFAERINPRLESIFAVGVDEMSWDDLDEMHYDWPSVEEVKAYRNELRQRVTALIETLPLTLPISWGHPWWPLLMGIEHERIHLETSSVLIRQHALEFVRPHENWIPWTETGPAPDNTLVNIPAGRIILNKSRSTGCHYGWDNEYGHHETDLPAFKASRFLVSNQEFLPFVEAGGYQTASWWEDEGQAWLGYTGNTHPPFWIKDGQNWCLRLMLQETTMPWDWPVEVNYHEARAWCNWKQAQTGASVRLPTEDEWYRLYDFAGLGELPADTRSNANIGLDYAASPCPVNRFAHGDLHDVAGNVWQWTETPIYPFEGFEVHPLYDDFTTPTFDGRHNLFKGGSWISCGNEALHSARYAFRRHFFQHAGFRYVTGAAQTEIHTSNYETDRLLSEYAEFHYGDEFFGVANFPKTLAQIAINAMGQRPALTALDLGCAAGRATFELARHFQSVTGVDFSARFIGLGTQMAEHGLLRYTLTDEGELVSYHERTLAALKLDHVKDKVSFSQGDACNLKPLWKDFDLVLAANLIDRLYDPEKFLAGIHARIKPGGLLMITSPYTWLSEHTPRAAWVGGYKQDGENRTTLDGLKVILERRFRLIQPPLDIPFVIRETRRKFQHTLSEVTLWERRHD